jgi:hypothetical protein
MTDAVVHQAILVREHGQEPRLTESSSDFQQTWTQPLLDMAIGFGERPTGVACPAAIFAQPIDKRTVAVVEVRDGTPGPDGWPPLVFHALVLSRSNYLALGADPFAIAQRFLPRADTRSTLTCPAQPLTAGSLAKVQAILQRTKPTPNGEAAPLSAETAESPTLLGGVQILVDGGRLVLERPRPDPSFAQALWTLLPYSLRPKLWPASFAFSSELGFDLLVVPRFQEVSIAGYTTEDQAGDYPPGSYELALQTAAESGNAHDLEAVFRRRSANETMKLTIRLCIGMALLAIAFRWLEPIVTKPPVNPVERAATAAGIIGAHDPYTTAAMLRYGDYLYREK